MTKQIFEQAKQLEQTISEKKNLLKKLETARVTGIHIKWLNPDFDEYQEESIDGRNWLPKGIIKDAMIRVVKDRIEHLQKQYDALFLPTTKLADAL